MTTRAFLSYARIDGETIAAELRGRLTVEAPDVQIVQDRLFLEGGNGWWKQITEAIESVDFVILLMTPAAIQSENVAREWRYARQKGVCVYPVKAAPHVDFEALGMPRWMSKSQFYELEKEWETFLAHLRKGCTRARVPFMAPDLPHNFIDRPGEFEALKNLLLSKDRTHAIAITTALSGAGGFGKTTLAAALCHDEDIIETFDDGILWVTLGQTPDLLSAFVALHAALTGHRPGFANLEDAVSELGQALDQRSCLLVIDDVWEASQLRHFLRARKGTALLFTTRNAGIAAVGSSIRVDEMQEDEAMRLLTRGLPSLEDQLAKDLVRLLGEWPLAIELACAMIGERVRLREPVGKAAAGLLAKIDRQGPHILEHPAAVKSQHNTISQVIEESLLLLTKADRQHWEELSVFPEDVSIPLGVAAAAWECNESVAEDVAVRLARLSLLRLDLEKGVLHLHDVMRSWLTAAVATPANLHARILRSWQDWHKLPNFPGEYAWRWLPWHLARAECSSELERILRDPVWMRAKVAATDVCALTSDYDQLNRSVETELLRGALRLSSTALAADKEQFASQLIGRLLPHQQLFAIERFIAELPKVAPTNWLRPLRSALHPPGTGLSQTLRGHSGSVSCVALSPDGKRIVSASSDKTLRVWDLETGNTLRKLEGHSSAVGFVAITCDGKKALSSANDHSMKLWDLETDRAVREWYGHYPCFAFGRPANRVVSALGAMLKVLDLETETNLLCMNSHGAFVRGIAVTRDGKRCVSASEDKTLKVWALDTGLLLRTLEGHSSYVYGVAITADAKRVVSASEDHSLRVWDMETGGLLLVLEGHCAAVTAVAITPDGKRAISASADNTLRVWDLETGDVIKTLLGHTAPVNCVTVTPEGKWAVSGSDDNTLIVWDLTAQGRPHIGEAHTSRVERLGITADQICAVSCSENSLKVWDLASGVALRTVEGPTLSFVFELMTSRRRAGAFDSILKGLRLQARGGLRALRIRRPTKESLPRFEGPSEVVRRTLHGNFGAVWPVVVTADGKRSVSSSPSNVLEVSDLELGVVLHRLEGHSSRVTSFALSPDSKRLVSASEDGSLIAWDLELGKELCRFYCDSIPLCCVFGGPRKIVAGDAGGHLHFLLLEEPRGR